MTAATLSPSSAPSVLLGSATPRLFTPPLVQGPAGPCGCGCALTSETSHGFEFADFCATVLGEPLLPWQRWLGIHLLELNDAGTYRFRTALILVARQNGKSFFARNLALWRMFMDDAKLVLGVAQDLSIAREIWQFGADTASNNPWLSKEVETVRYANGDQQISLTGGRRWRIAANNRSAGRGLSVDLLLLDELRETRTYDSWAALSKTITARPKGQIVAITNAGDDQSVVLNNLRNQAIASDDGSLALFEWSAPDGCPLDDEDAWAQANPALGHTFTADAIRASLASDPPGVFRTEVLCQHVSSLDGAIDMFAWEALGDQAGAIDSKRPFYLCVDVAPDLQHVTLAAAQALPDGRVMVAVAGSWDSTAAALGGIAEVVAEARPARLAWFPNAPTAAMVTDLMKMKRAAPLAAGDAVLASQGFAELVTSRRVVHNNDPLLTAHASGATKLYSGDGWRFTRRDVGHVDALYAAAGAAFLARSTNPPRPMVVVAANA